MTGGKTSDIVKEEKSFTVSANGKQVFTFKVPKQNDLYRLTITPSSQMYLNYLALYDGTWTAEQLGISNAASRRASSTEVTMYTSTTNSYTFQNLDHTKRYIYRVRALGEENTVSKWSEEGSFEFSATGIADVKTKTVLDTRLFDLQGREVTVPRKGIFIKNGRKVVY